MRIIAIINSFFIFLQLTSNYSVKIADFGLSQPLGNVQSVGGTPNYMVRVISSNFFFSADPIMHWLFQAPEMFDGVCDEKSDIYSFGLVLWEMMSGEYPWKDQLKKPEGKLPYYQQYAININYDFTRIYRYS